MCSHGQATDRKISYQIPRGRTALNIAVLFPVVLQHGLALFQQPRAMAVSHFFYAVSASRMDNVHSLETALLF